MNAGWTAALIDAVNHDNEDGTRRCATGETYNLIRTPPLEFKTHAALALADFTDAGNRPLSGLRSDTVATMFTPRLNTGEPNLVLARMTVPGGPWPGHFGLEAVIFRAYSAGIPTWFPKVNAPWSLDFGTVTMASNGFMQGQGAVLFPELLAVRQKLRQQSFGIVFIDRLAHLYLTRVVPILKELSIGSAVDAQGFESLRQLAFLAHEWGHLMAPIPSESQVNARRRRLVAIISEVYADLAGITMLLDSCRPEAMQAAEIILLDRIVREAWLPRAHAQVDSIAARHLLTILRATGFIEQTAGGATLRLDLASSILQRELEYLIEVEKSFAKDEVDPAIQYLTRHGWRIETSAGYHIDLSDGVSTLLRSRAATLGRRLAAGNSA